MERSANDAAFKDAQIVLEREEYALGMGQRSTYAAAQDAQINLKKEECASGMEQSANYEAFKVAKIGGVCKHHGAGKDQYHVKGVKIPELS